MPKKKEEPEVAAAVETTESAAEVTDIEPVPVEPAAEVSAEPIEPAAEEPPKPKRTRKKKTDAVDEEALPEPQPAAPKETAAKKKETAAADRQNKPKADPILTLEVGGEVTTETHEMDAAWHEILTSNRSHRILTGMLGGVEETEAGKTLAVVDYKGFRVVIPLKEMLVKLEKNLKGTEYLDVNGNKAYDPDIDTLYGELSEADTGVYEIGGLKHGGYLLLETKAPDGFTKDDRYFYFRIQKDGETVIVENEIGVGFTNEPIPTPTPEYPDSPKTGDDSKLWLWILLASGSLTVLITVSIVSRKKRKAL